MRFAPERRGEDVLRALEARALQFLAREKEILGAGLAVDQLGAVPGLRNRIERLAAGHVDDVEGGAGVFRERDRARGRLALELGRAREVVIFRGALPGLDGLLDQDVDRVAVLGVDADHRAVLGRLAHDVEADAVIDHEHVRVGHEQLEARDPLVAGERLEVGERLRERVEDDHVRADVDAAAGRARMPVLEAGERALAMALVGKVDHAGGAAEGRGRGAGAEGVDRARAAEFPVDVGVHVDRARHDQESARIVDLGARGRRQALAEHPDLAVLDQDVALELARRGHDPATFDQRRHRPRSLVIACPNNRTPTAAGEASRAAAAPGSGCLRAAPSAVCAVGIAEPHI